MRCYNTCKEQVRRVGGILELEHVLKSLEVIRFTSLTAVLMLTATWNTACSRASSQSANASPATAGSEKTPAPSPDPTEPSLGPGPRSTSAPGPVVVKVS